MTRHLGHAAFTGLVSAAVGAVSSHGLTGAGHLVVWVVISLATAIALLGLWQRKVLATSLERALESLGVFLLAGAISVSAGAAAALLVTSPAWRLGVWATVTSCTAIVLGCLAPD